jgi:hypothetical protein
MVPSIFFSNKTLSIPSKILRAWMHSNPGIYSSYPLGHVLPNPFITSRTWKIYTRTNKVIIYLPLPIIYSPLYLEYNTILDYAFWYQIVKRQSLLGWNKHNWKMNLIGSFFVYWCCSLWTRMLWFWARLIAYQKTDSTNKTYTLPPNGPNLSLKIRIKYYYQ